ncbi:RNA polymerase sigma-70 factor, ECF subfamily [Lentzea xinjiangensis]|uniref:RNA polymerase sigma-70 factor, ECF subfamily n=1 Tax=Lentzea xinjiangensis TaxID=402600 RepID=A0A1H9GLC7_9PSEU|nr:sigma-70 family RNA polymerase sigma factor [Lentzea xinjiangensis]SEQ50887.1 RNA polymerase sigma-70 factor, ECF subfamily [Lentzea xinjiangensis]
MSHTPSHGPPHERPAGDSATFGAFYEGTAEQVMATVCRMTKGDRFLAADAVQDAYLEMFRCWSKRQAHLRDDNRKYVVGIAANKVCDVYRRRQRLAELDEDLDAVSFEDDVVDRLDEHAALSAVRELIDRQPPRRRVVVTMYFLEEVEYADIARSVGITESTVRTQVERFFKLVKPLTDRFTDMRGGERS